MSSFPWYYQYVLNGLHDEKKVSFYDELRGVRVVNMQFHALLWHVTYDTKQDIDKLWVVITWGSINRKSGLPVKSLFQRCMQERQKIVFEHGHKDDTDWEHSERQSKIPELAHCLNVKWWILLLVIIIITFQLYICFFTTPILIFLLLEFYLSFAEIRKKLSLSMIAP